MSRAYAHVGSTPTPGTLEELPRTKRGFSFDLSQLFVVRVELFRFLSKKRELEDLFSLILALLRVVRVWETDSFA